MSEGEQNSDASKITIKASGNKNFEVETSAAATVAESKESLAEKSGVDAKQQRLIYSGRISKDPETLATYKIKSGNAVHLVKGAGPKRDSPAASNVPGAAGAVAGAPPTSEMAAGQETGNILSDLTGARYSGLASSPSASMFGPDGGQGPMPTMEDSQSSINSNPELMDQVASMMSDSANENSPSYQGMPAHMREEARTLMSNPMVRSMMSDPQRSRQFMQASMQSQQLTGGRGGAAGMGGLGDLGGLGALGNSGLFGFPPSAGSEAAAEGSTGGSNANANAAANPSAALGLTGFGGLGGLGGLGNYSAPPVDTRPPEERYETQSRQSNESGFVDFERNVRALRRSGGSVEGAVEALLDGLVE